VGPVGRGGRVGAGHNPMVEHRVLAEDRLLQPLQLLARFDPELLHQLRPRPAISGQRVGLAAGPVKRQHQLSVQGLPVGVRTGQGFQFGDQLAVPAHLEFGLDPLLQRGQPEVLQPPGGSCGKRWLPNIRQWNSPPQRER
jgi:hypothetical protein